MRARAAGGRASPHTTTAYRHDIAAIARYLAGEHCDDPLDAIRVSDLTVTTLRNAFADFAETRATSSLARAQATWRGFAGFCTQEGWLPGDPMAAIPRARPPRGHPKPLKGGEDTAIQLLTTLATGPRTGRNPWRERDLAVVATLLATGVRSSELTSLTLGDRYATAGDEYLRVLGKGRKERAVPILPLLSKVLHDYELSREARFPTWRRKYSDALFVNHRNEPLTSAALRWLVQTALKDAGLSGAPERQAFIHGFRHYAATQLASRGASATDIQALLGHASLNTSQLYIAAVGRELRAAVEANPAYEALKDLQHPATENANG